MLHEVGDKIGRFTIRRHLGEGGAGQVYLVSDPVLGIDVCLKVLRANMAQDPEMQQRFAHEVLLCRRISHPGICRVYDLHEEGDLRFLTMEFVDGESISDVLSRGRLDFVQAITIGIRMCEALDAAHRANVIHRDLKPNNTILRTPIDPVILDFGIATADDLRGLTRPGIPIGTMNYIAPEIWDGKPASVQSDIFAMGVLLYNMVTARHPFPNTNPVAILAAVKAGLYVQPSTIHESIPVEFDWIISAAVNADPAQRPKSAAVLRGQLQLLVGDEQTLLSPRLGAVDDDDTVLVHQGRLTIGMTFEGPTTSNLGPISSDAAVTKISLPPAQDADTIPSGQLPETLDPRASSVPTDEQFEVPMTQSEWADASIIGLKTQFGPALKPEEPELAPELSASNPLRWVVAGVVVAALVCVWFVVSMNDGSKLSADSNGPTDLAPETVDLAPETVDLAPETIDVDDNTGPDKDVASKDIASKDVSSKDVSSKDVSSKDVAVTTRPGRVRSRARGRRPKRPSDAQKQSQDLKRSLAETRRRRGIRRGDDSTLDRTDRRARDALKQNEYERAVDALTSAIARARAIKIDRSFVDSKLRRFNRRNRTTNDVQRKHLGAALRALGRGDYQVANREINSADDAG